MLWITSRVCMGDEAPNCGLNSEVEVSNVSADLQYQRPCAIGVRGHEPCEERRQGKSYECRGPTANYVCGRILYQNQVFSLRHSLPHFQLNSGKTSVVDSTRPIYGILKPCLDPAGPFSARCSPRIHRSAAIGRFASLC